VCAILRGRDRSQTGHDWVSCGLWCHVDARLMITVTSQRVKRYSSSQGNTKVVLKDMAFCLPPTYIDHHVQSKTL
jgi:hypothetical protein